MTLIMTTAKSFFSKPFTYLCGWGFFDLSNFLNILTDKINPHLATVLPDGTIHSFELISKGPQDLFGLLPLSFQNINFNL